MSAQFKDIPADEWEKEFYAEELKEARKIDKPLRVKASNYAAAFNALMEVGGISSDAYQALHVFLDKTRGCAPDEEIKFFSDKAAGALLPGDEGVRDSSLRKRWMRAWQELIEPEMARTGKRFAGTRQAGSISLARRGTQATKTAPLYTSDIAQAIVDVARLAGQMRGKREERFSRAALEVWGKLPAYVAPEVKVKLKAAPEPRAKSLAGGKSRRMNRFETVVREMVETSKPSGEDAVLELAARLIIKVGEAAAIDAGIDRESVLRLLAAALNRAADEPQAGQETNSLVHSVKSLEWTENTVAEENAEADEEKLVAPTQNEICENTEENDVSQGFTVDGSVHVKPESDKNSHSTFDCVSCGQSLTVEEVKVGAELCGLCSPPRAPGDEQDERELTVEDDPPDAGVTYGEEFLI